MSAQSTLIAQRAGRGYWQEQFPEVHINGNPEIIVSSPFRDDQNPSLSINTETGLWFDHATQDKGNIFQFHAQRYNMTEREAYKDLAQRYGEQETVSSHTHKAMQHKAPKPAPETVRDGDGESKEQHPRKPKAATREENITAVYTYTDADGTPLFQSVRYEQEGCEKTFLQRRKIEGKWVYKLGDMQPVLYRLPELIEDIALDRLIYIVEGEKDVDNLRAVGIPATCNPMGAMKWKPQYNEVLRGARVVIVPDNDEAGQKHLKQVASGLFEIANTIQVLNLPNLPEKGDVSDWLKTGGTVDELHRLTAEAPLYVPIQEEKNDTPAPRLRDEEKPPQIQRIEEYLLSQWDFRYNLMEDEPEYIPRKGGTWIKVDDRFASTVMRKMEYDGLKISSNRLRSILISDFSPEFDPFQDYFENLPKWDGTDYIREYANIVPVHAHERDTLQLYFRKWMIAAVATALGRGRSPNQTCLILIGAQGDGKTNFLRTLAPKPLRNYYTEAKIKRNDKDSEIMIARNFIINFDELQGLRKDEIEEFKSLGVRSFVKVRRQYATFTTVMRRTASFVGSTNQEDFLTDLTGARRFLCVKVHGRIGWQNVTDELVEGAYSQALHLLNEGVQYWFTDTEINEINERNEAYRQTLIEEELLLSWFERAEWDDARQYMTNTEILMHLLTKAPQTRIDPKNLGRALRKHGFIQRNKKRGGVSLKCYAVNQKLDPSSGHEIDSAQTENNPF